MWSLGELIRLSNVADCPLLALSRHRFVRDKCLPLTPKRTIRPPCRDIPWQLVNIVVQLAMQSFMNLFQPRNLIFCARACFLQPDHFLRPSSSAIRDFSAPLSTKGAGEKTEGGVCANAVAPTRTTVMAKTASALNGRFTFPRNRRSADIQFPRVCTS